MSRLRALFRGRTGAVLSVSLIVWVLAFFDLTLLPRVTTPFLVRLPPRHLVGVKVTPSSTVLTSADPDGDTGLWILDRHGETIEVVGAHPPPVHSKRGGRKRNFTADLRTAVKVPNGKPVDVDTWPGAGPALFVVTRPRRMPTLNLYSLRTGRSLLKTTVPLPPQESDRRNYLVADWSGPRPDLFVLDRDANRHKVRSKRPWIIRIYSGESDFKKLVLETRIRLNLSRRLSEPEWWVDVGYQDKRKPKREPKPNLVLVTRGRKTGSSQTEVHILSGRSQFNHFSTHAITDFQDRVKYPFIFQSDQRGGAVLAVKVDDDRLSLVPVPLP
jgi:hypothetical protein